MRMELHSPYITPDELPPSIELGLLDEADRGIDQYVADTHERLADIVDQPTLVDTVKHIVTETVPYDDMDSLQLDKDVRRAIIISREKRRRRFSKPILGFAGISYPEIHR